MLTSLGADVHEVIDQNIGAPTIMSSFKYTFNASDPLMLGLPQPDNVYTA